MLLRQILPHFFLTFRIALICVLADFVVLCVVAWQPAGTPQGYFAQ